MQAASRSFIYKYHAICYVPDVREKHGVTLAVVAISPELRGFVALKRIPSWIPVLTLDPEADIDLLNSMVEEIGGKIAADPQFVDQAVQWETSLRVLPAREFRTCDFEGTFSLLADAEFAFTE